MIWLVMVGAVGFGWLWGVVQGMVMIRPGDPRAVKRMIGESRPEGVRNHEWFGAYHLVCAAMMMTGLALVMAWDLGAPRGETGALVRYLVASAGCMAFGWEASELGYSWARYAVWVPREEHVVLLDAKSKRLYGKQVWRAHLVRIAVGGILMIGGGC